MFRKIVSALLGLGAVFFAGGLIFAPPAELAVYAILGAQTAAMLAGSILIWPRKARFSIPADLFNDAEPQPQGPAPLRFGRSRFNPR